MSGPRKALTAHPIGARLGGSRDRAGSSSWCRARKPDAGGIQWAQGCSGVASAERRCVVGVHGGRERPLLGWDATGGRSAALAKLSRASRRGAGYPRPTCYRLNCPKRPCIMVKNLPIRCPAKPLCTFQSRIQIVAGSSCGWRRAEKHGGLAGGCAMPYARARFRLIMGIPAMSDGGENSPSPSPATAQKRRGRPQAGPETHRQKVERLQAELREAQTAMKQAEEKRAVVVGHACLAMHATARNSPGNWLPLSVLRSKPKATGRRLLICCKRRVSSLGQQATHDDAAAFVDGHS